MKFRINTEHGRAALREVLNALPDSPGALEYQTVGYDLAEVCSQLLEDLDHAERSAGGEYGAEVRGLVLRIVRNAAGEAVTTKEELITERPHAVVDTMTAQLMPNGDVVAQLRVICSREPR